MSKSLQEQLLQTGAAKPKQAHKAKQEKAAAAKAAKQQGKKARNQAENSLQRDIERAAAEKRERDRALNAQKVAEQKARELEYSVSNILERNALTPDGDSTYNFSLGGAIRRMDVSESQRAELAAGRLAIVRHADSNWLVGKPVAVRLMEKVPERVWLVEDDGETEADDYYAEYEVPDDLIW